MPGPPPPLAPSSRSSLLAHPGFWVAVTLLALVLLLAAVLDGGSRGTPAPDPGPSISTLPVHGPSPAG